MKHLMPLQKNIIDFFKLFCMLFKGWRHGQIKNLLVFFNCFQLCTSNKLTRKVPFNPFYINNATWLSREGGAIFAGLFTYGG